MTALTLNEQATLKLLAENYGLTLKCSLSNYSTTSRKMKRNPPVFLERQDILDDLESIVLINRNARDFEMGAGFIHWVFSGNWAIFALEGLKMPRDNTTERLLACTRTYLATVEDHISPPTIGFKDKNGRFQLLPTMQEIRELENILSFLEDAVDGKLYVAPETDVKHLLKERLAGRQHLEAPAPRHHLNSEYVPQQKIDYGISALSKNFAVRHRISKDTRCPSDILAFLANDEEWWVRENVSLNPNTPESVLTMLASDPIFQVQAGVAYNPNTPADVLASFSSHPEKLVRLSLARNPSKPTQPILTP